MPTEFKNVKKCIYIFRAGDPSVNKGKHQVGDGCGAIASHPDGYCNGHALQFGLVSREKRDETIAKTIETIKQRRLSDAEASTVKTIIQETEKNPRTSMVDEEILDILGINRPYGLVDDYNVQKEIIEHPEEVNYAKKICFARWLETRESKRTPKTLEEVAEILGVTTVCLKNWHGGPFVKRFATENMKNRIDRSQLFAEYHLLERIRDRSDAANATWHKYYYEPNKTKENNKAAEIPEHLKDEATEVEKTIDHPKNYRGAGCALKESMIAAEMVKNPGEIEN